LLDVLASEWLVGEAETAKLRIYIIDQILPTLIPGLEKLLIEVKIMKQRKSSFLHKTTAQWRHAQGE